MVVGLFSCLWLVVRSLKEWTSVSLWVIEGVATLAQGFWVGEGVVTLARGGGGCGWLREWPLLPRGFGWVREWSLWRGGCGWLREWPLWPGGLWVIEGVATLAQGLWQWVSYWCAYSWAGYNWIYVCGWKG